MDKPPLVSPPLLKLGLLLLVVLPALPGAVFLLVGLLTDPHWHPRDPSPAGEAQYAREWARTRGLYLAGGATLIVGTLGMGAVVWKIARPGRPYSEEEAEVEEQARDGQQAS